MKEIKRFGVFKGDTFYASGGCEDFITSFATQEECEEFCVNNYSKKSFTWFQIVDMKYMNILKSATTEHDLKTKDVYIDWD